MPDFEQHLWLSRKVGVFIGILLWLISLVTGLLNSPLSFSFLLLTSVLIGAVGYYSTLVGGAAPDIDLSRDTENLKFASIPYRKLVALLRLLIALLVLIVLAAYVQEETGVVQIIGTIILVALGAVAIRVLPDILHRFMPGHRKLLHDLTFWAIAGLVGTLAIQRILTLVEIPSLLQTYLPLAVCIPIFLGVVTHTSMDTIESYVQSYAPDSLQRRAANLAPWVPKHKPVIVDIPQLALIALDKRAPWSIRLFVVFTAAYGVFPPDLIPDALIGIGWIEDLGIYLGLRRTVYSGYRREEGVIDTLRREASTVFKLYIPVLLLTLVSIAVYFILII